MGLRPLIMVERAPPGRRDQDETRDGPGVALRGRWRSRPRDRRRSPGTRASRVAHGGAGPAHRGSRDRDAIVVQPRSCRVAEAWPIHDDAAAVIEPPGESFQLIPGRDRAHGRQHQDRVGTRWTRHSSYPTGTGVPRQLQANVFASINGIRPPFPGPGRCFKVQRCRLAVTRPLPRQGAPPGDRGGRYRHIGTRPRPYRACRERFIASAIILLPGGQQRVRSPRHCRSLRTPGSAPPTLGWYLHQRRCASTMRPGAAACPGIACVEALGAAHTCQVRRTHLVVPATCPCSGEPAKHAPSGTGIAPAPRCDNWISPVGTRNLRRGSSARRSLLRCGQPGTAAGGSALR